MKHPDSAVNEAWGDVTDAIAAHAALYAKHEQEMVALVITRALEDEAVTDALEHYLHAVYMFNGEDQ